MISIYDNASEEWEQIDHCQLGQVLDETVDDTLDSATVVFEHSRKEAYAEFTRVAFFYSELGHKILCVGEDRSVLAGKMPGNLNYMHTMTLVEQTKILEKIIIPCILLRNKTDTLYQQLQKLLDNALPLYKTPFYNPRTWTISSDLKDALGVSASKPYGTIPGEDFYFQNVTLRAALDEMLSVINARVRASFYGDLDDINISFQSLEVGEAWQGSLTVVSRENAVNADDFAGGITAPIANGVSRMLVNEPISGIKCAESALTTRNALIQTRYPIEELNKLLFIPCDPGAHISGESYENFPINAGSLSFAAELDVTDLCLDKELYNLLPDEGDEGKRKYIYYSRGDTQINLSFQKNILGSIFDDLDSVLATKVNEWAAENADAINTHFGWEQGTPLTIALSYGDSKTALDYLLYKISYYPYVDTTVQATKPGIYSDSYADLTIIDGQGSGNVNTARYGANLAGKIARTGNGEHYIDCVAESFTDIVPLLSKIEEHWVVYRRTISVNHTATGYFYKIRYYLSKYFNNVVERVAINRETRVYNIPLTGVRSDIIDRNYIYMASVAKPLSERLYGTLYSLGLRAFALSFIGGNAQNVKPVDRLVASTYNGAIDPTREMQVYELATANIAAGNILVFKADYMDNFNAGYSIGSTIIGGKKVLLNPYANSAGEFAGIEFMLANGSDIALDDIKYLPLTAWGNYSVGQQVTHPTQRIYYKDAAQQISVVQQFEVIPAADDFETFIIGFAAINNNLLMTTENRPENLYLYLSNSKYTINEQVKAKGAKQPATTADLFTIDYDSVERYAAIEYSGDTISAAHEAWAIGDENGALYIAVNKNINNLDKIYFYCDKRLN